MVSRSAILVVVVYTMAGDGVALMQTAELFKNGRSQAVRLPEEFQFKGDRVFIKKVGHSVVLIPCQRPWQTLFESLDQFSDDFMESRE
jgi:antitoxin VapB